MNCEEKGQSGHRFLTARELLHVPETFHRWHGVVFDPSGVRFLHMVSDRPDGTEVTTQRTSLSSKLR
jgi:hypothetical protein